MPANWGDLPLILTAVDVARVLRVSKPVAYSLLNRAGFPSIRVSEKRILVSRDAFLDWLAEAGRNEKAI